MLGHVLRNILDLELLMVNVSVIATASTLRRAWEAHGHIFGQAGLAV